MQIRGTGQGFGEKMGEKEGRDELGENDATSLDLIADQDLRGSGFVSIGDLVEGDVGEEGRVGGSERAVGLEQNALVLAVLLELVLRVEGVKLDLVDGGDDGPSLGKLLDVRNREVGDSDGLEGSNRGQHGRVAELETQRWRRAMSSQTTCFKQERCITYLDLRPILVDLLHLSPSLVLVELLVDGSSSILVEREVVVGVLRFGLEVNGPVDEVAMT